MNETRTLTSPIVKALNRLPDVVAYRLNSGRAAVKGGWMHGAPEGTPDVLALVLGNSLFIETKTDEGELSAVQSRRHEELRRAGNEVIVARSILTAVMETTAFRARKLAEARKG